MEVWYEGKDGSIQDQYFYDGPGWRSFQFAAARTPAWWIPAVSRESDGLGVL